MHSLYDNEMKLEFLSKSNNEAFARITVAAFASQLDPTTAAAFFAYSKKEFPFLKPSVTSNVIYSCPVIVPIDV